MRRAGRAFFFQGSSLVQALAAQSCENQKQKVEDHENQHTGDHRSDRTFLTWTAKSPAVEGQALEIQGTNLVLSWPSQGYESYLIQYRQTLDESTPWTQLTNSYHANSTNRTTFTIYGVVSPPAPGGSSFAGDGDSASPSEIAVSDSVELMAMPKDGSGDAVPLALYPVGYDTNNLIIFEAQVRHFRSRSVSTAGQVSENGPGENGPLDDPPPDDPPSSGFYRVFHIPDWSFNITNYTYDGPTFLPVDFADYMDRVDDVRVLLDGQTTPYAEFMSYDYGGQTYWGVGVYFDRIASGTHQIQLQSTLLLTTEQSDSGPYYLVLSNRVAPITIDNQVTFTNWEYLVWDTNHTFNAQTKTLDTDWYIDIYDAYSGYVNGGSGHTTNGQIAWTWDLTDTYGIPRDSLDADPFFQPEITFTAEGQQATRYTPPAFLPYPDLGNWVVAYLDKFFTGDAASQYYLPAMSGIAGSLELNQTIPCQLVPISFGTNDYTQAQREASWATLKSWLAYRKTRNFYYFGHGGTNRIGCDMHMYDTNGVVIGGRDVWPTSKAHLDTKTVRDEITLNQHGQARQYRFVWLDGCDTAGGEWPSVFSVNRATNNLSFYLSSTNNPGHLRPSAFMGWSGVVGGRGWGNLRDSMRFRTQWAFLWSSSIPSKNLLQAIDSAQSTASWPPGGNNQLWGGLRAHGYVTLGHNEYNHANEWPPR